MRIIADFHIHSKFSRAVSKNMDLPHIYEWAKYKGINLIGTADFTHPVWFREIQNNLIEDGSGFLRFTQEQLSDSHIELVSVSQERSRNEFGMTNPTHEFRFVLTTEISTIYKQGEKVRKVHTIIVAPNLKTVAKINIELGKIGNLKADGRPILGMSVRDLAKLVLDINPECLVIPAHAWTPWFSIFGSKSGFDTIEECFGDMAPHIHAIETGLSSDPEMNWQLSNLDKITLLSNSDAHSPANLGREANVFEIDEDKFNYQEIADIIKTKDKKRFPYTIEFYPEEGKYHFDGDASCKQSIDPTKTLVKPGEKSICGGSITIGVLHRVEELADRQFGFKPKNVPGSKHIVPLREIISSAYGVGVQSKRVNLEYMNLVQNVASEFELLLDIGIDVLKKKINPQIAEGIQNVRTGNIYIEPGYDGIFGKVEVFKNKELAKAKQKKLF